VREHTGISVVIAGVAVAFMATLPWALAVAIWVAFSTYAAVKAIGSGSDAPNAVAIMVTVLGVVSLFVTALGATISVLGRSMTPARRRRRKDADLFSELPEPKG
jgi:4-amino-4-deoxy-L-arabinose transferase-like glycosyltransferase